MDQGSCKDGVLAVVPRRSLKFAGVKGDDALKWGVASLEKMEVGETLREGPCWCAFNAALEMV